MIDAHRLAARKNKCTSAPGGAVLDSRGWPQEDGEAREKGTKEKKKVESRERSTSLT